MAGAVDKSSKPLGGAISTSELCGELPELCGELPELRGELTELFDGIFKVGSRE